MKFAQIKYNNRTHVALVTEKKVIPIDFDGDMIDWILEDHSKPVQHLTEISKSDAHYLPPIMRPSKIIAIGLNYKDHAAECKIEIPNQPLVFSKFPNTLIGHKQRICWHLAISRQVDFEAELAVIIGKQIYRCSKDFAFDAVWGYTCANDVSARDLQFGDGQWVRGKSLDSFCPLGPWIVQKDEIPDPHNLEIQCVVNSRIMQKSNTNQMIFSIPELISFLSHHFTLYPGDIILTGTPDGVGVFRKPPVFLVDADNVSVEIEKIGCLANRTKVIVQ